MPADLRSGTQITLTELLAELVAINSVNPDLVPGEPGEADIGRFVADWLRAAGCRVSVESVEGVRANIIAVVPGSGGGRTLLLNAHLDTVGVADMIDAHRPVVRDGRLFGRGAGDTKAGVAAAMWTMEELARGEPLRGDVVFAAVIDEEAGSKGTEALARGWKADGAIVLEPTGLKIRIAHKGFAWMTVTTKGVAAHGARPSLGVDAIAKLARVIVEIEQLDARLRAGEPKPVTGTGSVHCSLIEGGSEMSSYPSSASVRIERRTAPGESLDFVREEMTAILDHVAELDPAVEAQLSVDFHREPLTGDPDKPIVRVTQQHLARELGQNVELVGDSAWTDAALLHQAGIPSIVFGPIGEGSHGANESVDLRSMEQCARVLTAIARDFCG